MKALELQSTIFHVYSTRVWYRSDGSTPPWGPPRTAILPHLSWLLPKDIMTESTRDRIKQMTFWSFKNISNHWATAGSNHKIVLLATCKKIYFFGSRSLIVCMRSYKTYFEFILTIRKYPLYCYWSFHFLSVNKFNLFEVRSWHNCSQLIIILACFFAGEQCPEDATCSIYDCGGREQLFSLDNPRGVWRSERRNTRLLWD